MSAGEATADSARARELATRLTAVRARVDEACAAAGRAPESVRLLPVTKFFPGSDVAALYDLGCRAFGESREQEAVSKLGVLQGCPGVEWHMIGRVQRKKARSVARWAHTVHSVDSERLANALESGVQAAREAGERSTDLRVLIQVSLDSDPARGGVAPEALPALADRIETASGLELAGLMAIPPLDSDSDSAFANLATLHTLLLGEHPGAVELSAGMSGDLTSAIAHGSTCVRVGTAVMGNRPITSE